jgi:ATP-dependent exoDNAse (exonuclease V) beta subunit
MTSTNITSSITASITSSMNTILNPVLCVKNSHPRDENIRFSEEGHKYTILDSYASDSSDSSRTVSVSNNYTSVTTWVHTHFPHFDADSIINKMMSGKAWKPGHKYWGLTADGIKDLWNSKRDNAAGAGTQLHYEIECFMNSKVLMFEYTHLELLQQHNILIKYDKRYLDFGIEWTYFLNFVHDFPHLKPYRTEWTVYHEGLKLAGSIDMVYENPDGTLSIYDWKRSADIVKVNAWNKCSTTKEIDWMPDSNFWHYALQLNAYKLILETKYSKIVKDLFLVRLHPDSDNYELIQVPDLKNDFDKLFNKS